METVTQKVSIDTWRKVQSERVPRETFAEALDRILRSPKREPMEAPKA